MSNLIGKVFRHRRYGLQKVKIVDHTGQNQAIPVDVDERIIFYYPINRTISETEAPESMTWRLFRQKFVLDQEQEPEEIDPTRS